MIKMIKNQKDLAAYITEAGDYQPDAIYIAQDRESDECFAITGCTYVSEAFRFVNDQFQLIISDDDYYQEQIDKQLNSKHPDLNPFYLRKEV